RDRARSVRQQRDLCRRGLERQRRAHRAGGPTNGADLPVELATGVVLDAPRETWLILPLAWLLVLRTAGPAPASTVARIGGEETIGAVPEPRRWTAIIRGHIP